MLIASHLASTVVVAGGLSLSGIETLMALLAGVFIDADHFLVNTKWFSDVKNFFKNGKITHGEVMQHSWFQEPAFGLIAGSLIGIALSLFIPGARWWVFPLFQGIHIFMDSAMKYAHQPLAPLSRWKYKGFIRPGSGMELIISSLVFVFIATAS